MLTIQSGHLPELFSFNYDSFIYNYSVRGFGKVYNSIRAMSRHKIKSGMLNCAKGYRELQSRLIYMGQTPLLREVSIFDDR